MDQWQRIHPRQFHARRYRASHAALRARQSLAHAQIPSGWMGWPYIDTLYDYAQFIKDRDEAQHTGAIASLPEVHWNTPVAIIGAGAAVA